MAGRFGQTHGCRPAKYGPMEFFLIILILKCKISLGHFNANNWYGPKWAKAVSALGPQPLAEIFFKNILNLFCNFRPKFQISELYLVKWLRLLEKSLFFWPLAPAQPALGREKKILRHTFLPKWTQKKFRPKRMKGGRVIRPFIYHRVTEWQSDRVTESRHFHSLYGWVKFFYTHFQ